MNACGDTVAVFGPRPALPLLLILALLAGGCQVEVPLANRPAHREPPSVEPPSVEPAPADLPEEGGDPWLDAPTGAPQPEAAPERMPDVQPGPYADDPRWADFVRGWPERVERALERLATVTGLGFAASGRPRVVLRAFGDETRRHELRAEIVEGRRRAVVHVNIEPLIARVADPDRVLLRALARAAFQDTSRRHTPVPPWFQGMAATVAAGDAEQRVEALRRRVFEQGSGVLAVDPEDPAAAEATALAALTLLAARLEPGGMRRAILFVADGDRAEAVLGRLVREADGDWTRPARLSLGERLAEIDVEPWRLLSRAREAVDELGPSGLDAVVPEEAPIEIADEIRVLRARASLTEGDTAAARTALRALGPDAPARLADPAAALALRIDVESRPGGDARRARLLAVQLDRDFPRSEARLALRAEHPLLGLQEDPQRWLATMRERIARVGPDALDLDTLERYLRLLVADHRAGAAAEVIAGLGARRAAPELEDALALVREAQDDPLPAAVARGRARVARWTRDGAPSGDETSARDVRETGAAAGAALLELLAAPSADVRAAAVGMLVDTVGDGRTVAAVRERWVGTPARIQRDLFALAAAVSFPALEPLLEAEDLGEPEAQALAKAWERVTLGLSRRWLAANPRFLQALRDPAFATRRDAVVRIGREAPGEVTPAFVAYALQDDAALLRREAAALAGITGFRALALRALADDSWLVREEAVRSIARIDGRDAVGMLATRLREDPSREVRAAAATGLVRAATESPRAVDALLRSQVSEEAALRDAIGTRLAELPPIPVVEGIVRGWERALGRREPSRGYLFRTALLYGRLTGTSLGYYPGASRDELRAMLTRMQDWLVAERARGPGESAGRTTRTPAGRGR